MAHLQAGSEPISSIIWMVLSRTGAGRNGPLPSMIFGPELWRLLRLQARCGLEGARRQARRPGSCGCRQAGSASCRSVCAQDPASKGRLADNYEIVYAPSARGARSRATVGHEHRPRLARRHHQSQPARITAMRCTGLAVLYAAATFWGNENMSDANASQNTKGTLLVVAAAVCWSLGGLIARQITTEAWVTVGWRGCHRRGGSAALSADPRRPPDLGPFPQYGTRRDRCRHVLCQRLDLLRHRASACDGRPHPGRAIDGTAHRRSTRLDLDA